MAVLSVRNIRGNVAAWAAIALLACLAGCSGKKPTYAVKGKVVDDDEQPAAGALIVFHPGKSDEGDPIKPAGHVDERGEFRLTTYRVGDGAPAGEYSVTVVWPQPRQGPFAPEGRDQLDGAYADPARSEIHFTVEKGQNEVPVIKVIKAHDRKGSGSLKDGKK